VVAVTELHRRACQAFGERVHTVGAGQWRLPTPCAGWDVAELVNHVVAENRWTEPMLEGRRIDEVGDRFNGDLLGDDPAAAWDDSASAATAAVGRPGAMEVTAHLSFGDVSGKAYTRQLFADLLVHAWDLARATGGDERLDPALVSACAEWFDAVEDDYRAAGVIGAPVAVPGDADAQSRLLARFGRDPSPDTTLAVVRRFNEAFGRGDIDAVMRLMTDDCVFEDTTPPNGNRAQGQASVRAAWEAFFAGAPSPAFETEEGVVAGDRATYRWRYHWDGGHVRGVDILRVRDGKVAEKLSYVKG